MALGAAWPGVARSAETPAPAPLQLPCLAELVEQARSGEGPLAFEEAFFDGPYHRVTSKANATELIDEGHALLHGFWNAEAERHFREAFTRDPESVEALLGLALTNAERPRRFETFLAKAEAVARARRSVEEETRWWLASLRESDPAARRQLLEKRVATHPAATLPTLWLGREAVLGFHRQREHAGSRAAWDRLLAASGSPTASTYRRLLWANDPPADDLPGLVPPDSSATADAWRIAGEFEKHRGRLEAALDFHVAAVRADLDWLASRIALPDDAQNLGANSAALALLLADLGRGAEAREIAARFRDLPYHPGAAGTTQPWRRVEDTCREANRQALEQLAERGERGEAIDAAIAAGRLEDALAMANEDRAARPWAFDAKAREIEVLWKSDRKKDALFAFDQAFRKRLARADAIWLDSPVFAEMAEAIGIDPIVRDAPDSTALDALAWRAPEAPSVELVGGDGNRRSLGGRRERATLAIFFLGAGCPRCVEQLTTFLPHVDAFTDAGVDVIGISTDAPEETADDFPIPLFADPDLAGFHACGVYDEFLERPLHGTFLIDANGAIRWREIGNTAFLRADFLLNELPVLLPSKNAREKD